MAHTKETIIKEIKDALKTPATLYQQAFTKRAGHNQCYSEIAATELLSLYKSGEYKIPKIERTEGYYIDTHADLAKEKPPKDTNQKEKWAARAMFGRVFEDVGKIIDFETPLYTSGTSAGAIDLLAYDSKRNVLTILEYKRKENDEPLIRCVLEAFTYREQVEQNKKAFIEDFQALLPELSMKTKIEAAVFVHKDSKPDKHYRQAEDTQIRKLMIALNVGFSTVE